MLWVFVTIFLLSITAEGSIHSSTFSLALRQSAIIICKQIDFLSFLIRMGEASYEKDNYSFKKFAVYLDLVTESKWVIFVHKLTFISVFKSNI